MPIDHNCGSARRSDRRWRQETLADRRNGSRGIVTTAASGLSISGAARAGSDQQDRPARHRRATDDRVNAGVRQPSRLLPASPTDRETTADRVARGQSRRHSPERRGGDRNRIEPTGIGPPRGAVKQVNWGAPQAAQRVPQAARDSGRQGSDSGRHSDSRTPHQQVQGVPLKRRDAGSRDARPPLLQR